MPVFKRFFLISFPVTIRLLDTVSMGVRVTDKSARSMNAGYTGKKEKDELSWRIGRRMTGVIASNPCPSRVNWQGAPRHSKRIPISCRCEDRPSQARLIPSDPFPNPFPGPKKKNSSERFCARPFSRQIRRVFGPFTLLIRSVQEFCGANNIPDRILRFANAVSPCLRFARHRC